MKISKPLPENSSNSWSLSGSSLSRPDGDGCDDDVDDNDDDDDVNVDSIFFSISKNLFVSKRGKEVETFLTPFKPVKRRSIEISVQPESIG